MRVSFNTQRELKAGSEWGEKNKLGREKSAKGGTAWVLTFVRRCRKEDIFQFKSMLDESGSSNQLAYSLNRSPGESDKLLSFLLEI